MHAPVGLLLIAAAAAGMPAAAGARQPWTAPQDVAVASAGQVTAVPAVGTGGRDGTAVLIARRAGRGAVVVLRRTRSGRLGRPLVLAREPAAVFHLALTIRPGGDAVTAWTAYVAGSRPGAGNHRVHAVRVAIRARAADTHVLELTRGGSSAYDPTFVPGVGGPLLAWERRTGPVQAARWHGDGPPEQAAPVGLPVAGVAPLAAAGSIGGRVAAAFPGRAGVRVAFSADAGRSFGPATTVAGSHALAGLPVLALGSTGAGAVAWADRDVHGTRILAAGIAPGAGTASAARVLAAPVTAPSPPVIAAREAGGALVAWGVTQRRSGLADGSTGYLYVQGVGADGRLLGPPFLLGDQGERGRRLQLVSRGGYGALAVWVTPSRALRAQDLGPDGRPGRAVTLDRGVDPLTVRVAGRGPSAVTWQAHGHLRLALKP